MALEKINLPIVDTVPRGAMDILLREADDRIDAFFDSAGAQRMPRYIPSDALSVYAALTEIRRMRWNGRPRLCEWGSGFGVSACLAAMMGFEAVGIEIEPELASHARRLAKDFDLPVRFYCGTLVPDGCDLHHDPVADMWALTFAQENAPPEHYRYPKWGFSPSDFDVIFAYPWPGESRFMEELFARTAREGSLLLTYYGIDDLNLFRKTQSIKK